MITKHINKLIHERRSIYPHQFIKKNISNEIIQELLSNANMAPTHKLTQPWRFKVIQDSARKTLGEFLSKINSSRSNSKILSSFKNDKIIQKCLMSNAIIVICMQRDSSKSIPKWEEIASTSMAVQNIWLSCTAYGIGCYWSSPKSIEKIGDLIKLNPGERCLGFLYLGYYKKNEKLFFKRDPINSKVDWINSFN